MIFRGQTLRVEVSRCLKVTAVGSMLLREKDYIDNEYYVYNRLLFRLLGLWDYQISSKQLIYVCFINLILVIGLFENIYALTTSERKIRSILELLEMVLPTICFGLCYYNLLFNSAIMQDILFRVKCDWNDLANTPELMILKKYAGISRLCTIIIAVSFYVYTAFLILPSLFSITRYIFGVISEDELILPIPVDYLAKDQLHYYFGVCIQCVIIIVITTMGIANYTMYIAIIQHACALFQIIEWKIDDRFKKQSHNFDFVNDNTDLVEENEWLVGIIKFYNNAIEFVDLIKLFYETLCLFEAFFAATVIMIDYFYIFQVLSLDMNKLERITNISFVIGSIFVIYTCYYIGQRLIDHSDNVFKAFCQIPFHLISVKAQKMLLFLIMRSMKLCNISVMGIKEVSHDLFATLMRSSFSFVMVFYNLQ